MQSQKAVIKPLKAVIAAVVFSLVMLLASLAFAQGHIQLNSVAEVEKEVVNQEGKKEVVRVPAKKVLPGMEVIYTNYYENISKQAAEKAVITNPIPEHLVYKAGSAKGAGTLITFSIDGGKTYDVPAKLFIVDAAGRQFPAQPRHYTHIRWTFEKPLPSGAKGAVSFRAILK